VFMCPAGQLHRGLVGTAGGGLVAGACWRHVSWQREHCLQVGEAVVNVKCNHWATSPACKQGTSLPRLVL
jgi:hypothetical protein